jgi:spore cortex biosynthesis protein YabQ
MSAQVALFIYTVAIGALTGVLYDVIRLFRRLIRHSHIISNIEDGLYWAMVSIIMFYFMLNQNYGEVRLFSIIGFFMGMGLYFLTISGFVLLILTKVAKFIKNVLTAAFKILIFPIKILVNIMKTPLNFLLSFFSVKTKSVKKVLQKSKRYAKMKRKKLVNDINVIFKKV